MIDLMREKKLSPRRNQQMHPRDSRYSSRSFVTQPALSATRPTIDPTKNSLFPSHFLLSSHCHSLLSSFSFSLFLPPSLSLSCFLSFFFLVISPRPLHDTQTCFFPLLAPVAHSPAASFSISLFSSHSLFVTFSSNPLHYFPRPNLSISINIDSAPSLTLSTHLFLFTLFSSIYSTYFLPSSSHHFANFYPSLFLLFSHLNFFAIVLFRSPVLHCIDFIYFFCACIRFNKVGGHVLPVLQSREGATRGMYVVRHIQAYFPRKSSEISNKYETNQSHLSWKIISLRSPKLASVSIGLYKILHHIFSA